MIWVILGVGICLGIFLIVNYPFSYKDRAKVDLPLNIFGLVLIVSLAVITALGIIQWTTWWHGILVFLWLAVAFVCSVFRVD